MSIQTEKKESIYPEELSGVNIEYIYIGLLLQDPKLISKFYILYEDAAFLDAGMLNMYKSILFKEGEAYAPETAKREYTFAKITEDMESVKKQLIASVEGKNYDFEKVYIELRKMFILRKSYLSMPLKNIQQDISEIRNYELYNKMTIEEVKSAVEQVCITGKFKRAILNKDLTPFLLSGDNNLRKGLELPFKILSSVFKGVRTGEVMSFAMPSNAGKSRFTINIAAYIAFVHKKKVLVISNEMSEDKMRLCLTTTILNNPEIQKLHGQKLHKSEGELLEFKFRADEGKKVKVDEEGFILREEGEKQEDFVKRISENSTEFNKVVAATNWLNTEANNSIYFINITDHTNDELKKVMMNYYYKNKVEYIFYDTLKTDIDNIGNGEELKKTATVLANIAQNFNVYIGSTLQLMETSTLPVNLTINDLSSSRTVKEVLDTLCLFKQIHKENYGDYEYSLEEVSDNYIKLEKFKDPDVRYYACVVDKNRAGAKPTLLFRLNLAYNSWEELGYLRLKQ